MAKIFSSDLSIKKGLFGISGLTLDEKCGLFTLFLSTNVIWQKKNHTIRRVIFKLHFHLKISPIWRIFFNFRDRFYLANIQLNGIWLKNSSATFSPLIIVNGKIGKSIMTFSILFLLQLMITILALWMSLGQKWRQTCGQYNFWLFLKTPF